MQQIGMPTDQGLCRCITNKSREAMHLFVFWREVDDRLLNAFPLLTGFLMLFLNHAASHFITLCLKTRAFAQRSVCLLREIFADFIEMWESSGSVPFFFLNLHRCLMFSLYGLLLSFFCCWCLSFFCCIFLNMLIKKLSLFFFWGIWFHRLDNYNIVNIF